MIRQDYFPSMSQSEWENAPFSQREMKPKEVEVSVSVTLSKTVKVQVDDYTVNTEYEDNGELMADFDFSECDLKSAVKEQVDLPGETLEGWCVDDFEVVLD